MTWNFTPAHQYKIWVHAVSSLCEGPATEVTISAPSTPTVVPTNPPAPTNTPVPASITPPSSLSASCPNGNEGVFTWSAGFKGNIAASNYTLRINKEPFGDWMGPGDQAYEVGNDTTVRKPLSAGNYGFSVQAGFPDGSTSTQVLGNQFTCSAVVNPTPTPTGTITPTPTPVPAGAVATAVSCPTGTSVQMINSVMVCVSVANANNNTNTNTVTVTNNNTTGQGTILAAAPAAAQAQVAGVSTVNSLPKTGLPMAAWLLSGLLPMGAGLKKFAGRGDDEASVTTPTYLWQKRRFMQG